MLTDKQTKSQTHIAENNSTSYHIIDKYSLGRPSSVARGAMIYD